MNGGSRPGDPRARIEVHAAIANKPPESESVVAQAQEAKHLQQQRSRESRAGKSKTRTRQLSYTLCTCGTFKTPRWTTSWSVKSGCDTIDGESCAALSSDRQELNEVNGT
eukprot:477276-Hanusia_phi.AAC.6